MLPFMYKMLRYVFALSTHERLSFSEKVTANITCILILIIGLYFNIKIYGILDKVEIHNFSPATKTILAM